MKIISWKSLGFYCFCALIFGCATISNRMVPKDSAVSIFLTNKKNGKIQWHLCNVSKKVLVYRNWINPIANFTVRNSSGREVDFIGIIACPGTMKNFDASAYVIVPGGEKIQVSYDLAESFQILGKKGLNVEFKADFIYGEYDDMRSAKAAVIKASRGGGLPFVGEVKSNAIQML